MHTCSLCGRVSDDVSIKCNCKKKSDIRMCKHGNEIKAGMVCYSCVKERGGIR